jgi:hypothetical protein
VLEDGPGGGGTEDDGHHAARAAAARAGENVGPEGPPEEIGPGNGPAGWPVAERLRRYGAGSCLGQRRRGRRRN